MDEFPKKNKTFSVDLYSGGGSGSFSRELHIEWDVLAAASDRCLVGRVRGFVEREIIRETAASVLWRLWNYELGEMGTFEVRKLRPGWSQITFSGLGPLSGFREGKEEIKKKHMGNIIDAYYFMLSQEDIFPDREMQEKPNEEWQPWIHIPEGKEGNKDKEIVELWCKGKGAKTIADEVIMNYKTVFNIISKLRRDYPEARIPKDRERKSVRF